MKPLLLFHNHLRDSQDLLEGRLLLINSETDTIANIYRAASGCAGWQEFTEIASKGRGPIPPPDQVGIDHYTVKTIPIYMPQVKGVEGNFYKINPHEVQIKGVTRGDFGIHKDANVPGTIGCIGLVSDIGWQAFIKDMAFLASEKIAQVPLLVSYTH